MTGTPPPLSHTQSQVTLTHLLTPAATDGCRKNDFVFLLCCKEIQLDYDTAGCLPEFTYSRVTTGGAKGCEFNSLRTVQWNEGLNLQVI